MNMVISNGNILPSQLRSILNSTNHLAVKAPTALNSSIISRIHNVKPGCGSCGRK